MLSYIKGELFLYLKVSDDISEIGYLTLTIIYVVIKKVNKIKKISDNVRNLLTF